MTDLSNTESLQGATVPAPDSGANPAQFPAKNCVTPDAVAHTVSDTKKRVPKPDLTWRVAVRKPAHAGGGSTTVGLNPAEKAKLLAETGGDTKRHERIATDALRDAFEKLTPVEFAAEGTRSAIVRRRARLALRTAARNAAALQAEAEARLAADNNAAWSAAQ